MIRLVIGRNGCYDIGVVDCNELKVVWIVVFVANEARPCLWYHLPARSRNKRRRRCIHWVLYGFKSDHFQTQSSFQSHFISLLFDKRHSNDLVDLFVSSLEASPFPPTRDFAYGTDSLGSRIGVMDLFI
jgi:hypothetical protein